MVKRMKNLDLAALQDMYGYGPNIVRDAAAHVLNSMTREDVVKNYKKCYDFFAHWNTLD